MLCWSRSEALAAPLTCRIFLIRLLDWVDEFVTVPQVEISKLVTMASQPPDSANAKMPDGDLHTKGHEVRAAVLLLFPFWRSVSRTASAISAYSD